MWAVATKIVASLVEWNATVAKCENELGITDTPDEAIEEVATHLAKDGIM